MYFKRTQIVSEGKYLRRSRVEENYHNVSGNSIFSNGLEQCSMKPNVRYVNKTEGCNRHQDMVHWRIWTLNIFR